MATNAERQRAYRQRRLSEGTDTRLDVLLSAHAAAALDRLARHKGTSKRATLEALLAAAEAAAVEGMAHDAQRAYFGHITR